MLGKSTGKHILDLGCGSGLEAKKIACTTGDQGLVIGIDRDYEMLKCATESDQKHIPDFLLQYTQADACQLPFADHVFDTVRSERLLMHIRDTAHVIQEIIRVTKPNGTVLLIDTDWGSLSTATGKSGIERRLTQFIAEHFLTNGYSGRLLYGLLNQANMTDIVVKSIALCTTDPDLWRYLIQADRVEKAALAQNVISEEELRLWKQSQKQTALANSFVSSITVYLVSAKIPN